MVNQARPLKKLGFLTIGLFDEHDPATGHENTLRLIELSESLRFDSAWLRHRHLQHGISSPVAVLAAATQRTQRIALGTAVTPLGWENPLRLAEDWATLDVLSGGRLNPGLSVGLPMNYEHFRDHLYPDTADAEDFSYHRVERLLNHLRGEPVSTLVGTRGIETFSDRVQPHAAGLVDRVWYGAGSLASATWTGQNNLRLLSSNVVKAEQDDDFARIQRSHIDTFRAHHRDGERATASQGLVVIPTDSASATQKDKYHQYAADRFERTKTPQGPAKMLFSPDLVGSSDEIAEQLRAHAGFQAVDEVVFALPFTLEHADYEQILTDIAEQLAPRLGWQPRRADG